MRHLRPKQSALTKETHSVRVNRGPLLAPGLQLMCKEVPHHRIQAWNLRHYRCEAQIPRLARLDGKSLPW